MRILIFSLLAIMLAVIVSAAGNTVFGAPGAVQATPAKSEHYSLEPVFADTFVIIDVTKESDNLAAARKAFAALKPGDKDQFALLVDRFIGEKQVDYRQLGITDAQIKDNYLIVRDEQLLQESDGIIDGLLRMQTSHDFALMVHINAERIQMAANRRSYEAVRKQYQLNIAPPAPKITDNRIPPPVKEPAESMEAPEVHGAIPLTEAEMKAVHAP